MSKKALLEQAKLAESANKVDEAAKAYLRAGEFEDAIRVLMGASKFSAAGKLLLKKVGLPLGSLGKANAAQRKLAVRAAICLSKGKQADQAVAIFVAVGDGARAVETLERGGDSAAAARLKSQLDRGDAHRELRALCASVLSAVPRRAPQPAAESRRAAAL